MAPEQLEGESADVRTDIFALGAVLYEMATGRRAFEGKTRTSLIAAIVAGQPRPVSELQPQVPPALQHVVAVCMEKDPDLRWQSAHDVAEQLRWIARSGMETLSGSTTAAQRRWLIPALAAALLTGLIAGAFFWRLLRPAAAVPLLHAAIVSEKNISAGAWSPEGGIDVVALSPDGSRLAWVGRDATGKAQLWLRRLDSGEERSFAGTEGARQPFWSADGKWLAFFASAKLKKVPIDGGPPVTICDVGSNPLQGSWNRQDVILFSPGSGTPLHRVSASGGEPVAVTRLDTAAGETTHRYARFLPDGETFLYTAGSHDRPENSEVHAVYASKLGSDDRTLVLRGRTPVEYVNGQLLFARDHVLYAQGFDRRTMKLSGEAKPLVRGVHMLGSAFQAAFTASDERLVYVSRSTQRGTELVWLDREGNQSGVVKQEGEYERWSLSPDHRLAAIAVGDPTEGQDIWLLDLTRGGLTRFTTGGGNDPVWSPDGRRLAWAAVDRKIYVKPITGGNAEVLWDSRTWGGPTAWSADGRHVGYWTFDPQSPTSYDAFMIRDGKELIPIAASAAIEFAGFFSPDGRWITFVSNESGRDELYAASVADPAIRQQISVEGAVIAIWPRANEIIYRQPDGAWISVDVTASDGQLTVSSPRVLFSDPKILMLQAAGEDRFLAQRQVGESTPPRAGLVTGWKRLTN
jgi:eukaryotic-like serine/threonine-protein kinase